MRTIFPHSQQSRGERAIALVITLAMIVLITFSVIAFFSRVMANRAVEASRANQVKVGQLTLTGADYVVGQVLQEIASKSTRYGKTGTTADTNAPFAFMPNSGINADITTTGTGMVPVRAVSAAVLVTGTQCDNLIRQSIVTADSNASTHSTTQASRNQRTIAASRWNAPILVSGTMDATQVPNWIYVQSDGSVTSTPTGKEIGRFAYNIYDIGGLIDAKTQGFPQSLTVDQREQIKAQIIGGDLTAIPGVDGTALFNWRGPASAALSGSAFITQAQSAAAEGFLKKASGDNGIASRQDLIKLAATGTNGIVTGTAALPNLTHFSRASNAPGFIPTTPVDSTLPSPSKSSVDYAANANSRGTANRFTPNVRVLAPFTRRDGTTAVVGEPLIKSRFALCRLGELGLSGPVSPATSGTVQKDFGLVWNSGNTRWDYVGATGNTIQHTIETLDQVAAENREPNFFELLKAAILAGSLGQGPADKDGTMGMLRNPFYSRATQNIDSLGVDLRPRLPDYQIIQIGANIIDQFDADDIPTAIMFDTSTSSYTGSTGAKSLRAMPGPFLGTENLPYINKLFTRHFRPSSGFDLQTGATQPAWRSWIRGWLCFELWNPHSNASQANQYQMRIIQTKNGTNDALNIMSKVRTNAAGGTITGPYSGTGTGSNNSRQSSPAAKPGDQTISFMSGPVFKTPVTSGAEAARGAASNSVSQGNFVDSGLSWVGLWLGDLDEPDSSIPGTLAGVQVTYPSLTVDNMTAAGKFKLGSYSTEYGANFELQVLNGSGWRTVQILNGACQTESVRPYSYPYFLTLLPVPANYTETNYINTTIGCNALAFPDPRTTRFGMTDLSSGDGVLASSCPWNDNPLRATAKSIAGASGNGIFLRLKDSNGVQQSAPYADLGVYMWTELGYSIASLCENLSTANCYVRDRDNILRPGDGYLATSAGYDALGLGPNAELARPVMLNRPFRSVGELGAVFRDQPWKTLDFFSDKSADAALLDFFSVNEEAATVAGKINLNSAGAATLQSFIVGADRIAPTPGASAFTAAEAATLASDLRTKIKSQPLLNLGDIVARVSSLPKSDFGSDAFNGVVKTRREAVVRALAAAGQVRTWGLFLDVIAQTGKFPTGTSSFGAGDFVVEGEARQWTSVAVDRLTGKVLDRQVEWITE